MEQIRNLLESLSDLCRMRFSFSDGSQDLFSPESAGGDPLLSEKVRGFSADVVQDNRFRHEAQDGWHFYGTPVATGEAQPFALVAHEEQANGTDQSRIAKVSKLLSTTSQLISDWKLIQKESDDLADELADSFEAITLYSRITPQITTFGFSVAMLRSLIVELLDAMDADVAFTVMPNRAEHSLSISRPGEPRVPSDLDRFVRKLVAAIPPQSSSVEDHYHIVNDSRLAPGYVEAARAPFRFLCTAIEHQGDLYGWLGMVAFNMDEIFRRSELRMLSTVAKQIAVALSNSELYLELEHLVVNVVRSLVNAIEAKDVYTRGHSERVSQYCMKMADSLKLDKEEKRSLRWAAILHDTGKIGIPESVLNKPGRLTDEEYELIKGHPGKGYHILKPLKPLASSLSAILHHHESYNGKGYPSGLKGEEIPFHARIIAIADTFDAITSNRSYRPCKKPEEALTIIRQVAGTQLDPDLVKVFDLLFPQHAEKSDHGDSPKTGVAGL